VDCNSAAQATPLLNWAGLPLLLAGKRGQLEATSPLFVCGALPLPIGRPLSLWSARQETRGRPVVTGAYARADLCDGFDSHHRPEVLVQQVDVGTEPHPSQNERQSLEPQLVFIHLSSSWSCNRTTRRPSIGHLVSAVTIFSGMGSRASSSWGMRSGSASRGEFSDFTQGNISHE